MEIDKPTLIVISASIQFPGGKNSFLATHCVLVSSPASLALEIRHWREKYEADGCTFLNAVITEVPRNLYEQQHSKNG